jgi:hypothetical protein
VRANSWQKILLRWELRHPTPERKKREEREERGERREEREREGGRGREREREVSSE